MTLGHGLGGVPRLNSHYFYHSPHFSHDRFVRRSLGRLWHCSLEDENVLAYVGNVAIMAAQPR